MITPRSLFLTAAALLIVAVCPAVPQVAFADGARAGIPDFSSVDDHPSTGGLPAFRKAVKVIGPAVVNISTTREVQARVASPHILIPGHGGTLFRDDVFGRFFQLPQPRHRLEQHSLGSGVVVSEDGYILTNNHVVQGATQVTATLADGRSFEAEVVGMDAPTDIAVLKIEGEDLVAATMADSGSVEVGDWVLAVGSPFGLGHTVTSGIVSAKGRSGVGVTEYEDFLQTDAAINPGNSGGPLVDLEGRIVGINTAIASRSGGSMGIGFAIPAELAANVMTNLIQHGRVDRGWLGVFIQDLAPEMAASFGFTGGHGVLVTQVMEDSPADHAGVREGDIVTKLNGKAMKSSNTLATTIATFANGTDIELEVFRDGAVKRLDATIGRSGREADERVDSTRRLLGIHAESVTPALVQRHRLAVAEGAFVTEVDPEGLAARLGIRPGDVILAVGNERIASAEELREALARESLESGIRLLLDSNGRRQYVLVRQQH